MVLMVSNQTMLALHLTIQVFKCNFNFFFLSALFSKWASIFVFSTWQCFFNKGFFLILVLISYFSDFDVKTFQKLRQPIIQPSTPQITFVLIIKFFQWNLRRKNNNQHISRANCSIFGYFWGICLQFLRVWDRLSNLRSPLATDVLCKIWSHNFKSFWIFLWRFSWSDFNKN